LPARCPAAGVAPRSAGGFAPGGGVFAGLAAAFNTPLAATTFVLEEIIGDLNSRMLGAVLLASVLGALVSQAVSRRMNRENFYNALLTQDGHRVEHVRPPRDLRAWHQLPVSALANFAPVILRDLSATELRRVLEANPYQRFPVVWQGKLAGVLTRQEAEAALAEKRNPKLAPATTCLRDQTVAGLQRQLIESETHMVVILDRPDGEVIGLVTLHDLLRAESDLAQKMREEV
jgi:CIC family chloride channel protein